jgi:hypothetical protein
MFYVCTDHAMAHGSGTYIEQQMKAPHRREGYLFNVAEEELLFQVVTFIEYDWW